MSLSPRDHRAARREILRSEMGRIEDKMMELGSKKAEAQIDRRHADATIRECDEQMDICKARKASIEREMLALREEPVRMVSVKAHMRKVPRRRG